MIQGIKKIRDLIKNQNSSFVQELKDFITIDLKYYDYLLEDDENTWEERKENVEELFMSLTNQLNEDSTLSFEDFVNSAVLQSSQDEVDEGDFVSLMTVHTAKGLEYDYVFVYSLGDGIFPSRKAIDESRRGIEEERRLAYVAYTRAKKRLYLSSNQDYSFTIQSPLSPSRFIKEAGIKIPEDYQYFQKRIGEYRPQGLEKINNLKKPQIDSRITNGVDKWSVGERAEHEKFGEGVVVEVINQLIIIKFDNKEHGKKTFLGSHISIKKL